MTAMHTRQLVLSLGLLVLVNVLVTGSPDLFISNLSDACYRCLCYVSTRCDRLSHDCSAGYCGPYNISKLYWIDAGRIVLPGDDPDRWIAWEDCARNYNCAKMIITGYLGKFGRDCNGDGVTDCFDYMMINRNGAYSCTDRLELSTSGREWLRRFEDCRYSL